jgi:hypothetical protein
MSYENFVFSTHRATTKSGPPFLSYNRVTAIRTTGDRLLAATVDYPGLAKDGIREQALTLPTWLVERAVKFVNRELSGPPKLLAKYNCHSFAAEIRLGHRFTTKMAEALAYDIVQQSVSVASDAAPGTQEVISEVGAGSVGNKDDVEHSLIAIHPGSSLRLHVVGWKDGLGLDDGRMVYPQYTRGYTAGFFASGPPVI